ncbi:MAG TPA: hypothetical protein VFZ42_15110 [Chitinophagaceae bacterium]
MRLTDRLLQYLEFKEVSVYSFEKKCGLGNGYFGKQARSKGAINSDILERIAEHYPDLHLDWLITGKGKMLQKPLPDNTDSNESVVNEKAAVYHIKDKLIRVLKEQLKVLETLPAKGRKRSK